MPALVWHVRIVPMDEEFLTTGGWEPFAVVVDENAGPCLVVKRLIETEGEKSSIFPGNQPMWDAPDPED